VLAVRRAEDGGIVFDVRDTGIGMTPEEISIALQPFGQLDSGLDRRREGTGLGLPLARSLVELNGGTLEIRSEKGRGTTVTVRLAAGRRVGTPPAPPPIAARAAPGLPRSRVRRAHRCGRVAGCLPRGTPRRRRGSAGSRRRAQ